MSYELARLPKVIATCGLSRSGLYKQISLNLFTPPIQISDRCVAWPVAEVEAINSARIAGYSKDEIRRLVSQLIAGRKGNRHSSARSKPI